jgi:hypothetical protein
MSAAGESCQCEPVHIDPLEDGLGPGLDSVLAALGFGVQPDERQAAHVALRVSGVADAAEPVRVESAHRQRRLNQRVGRVRVPRVADDD